MWYRISRRFSAVVPIVATFLPLTTRPTMRGRRNVKTYHAGPTQLEQPESTLHGQNGPAHPAAADNWAATATANRTKCWQQYNNLTRGHAATRLITTENTRRETNDLRDSLQRPNRAGKAHMGRRTTPEEPTTGSQDNGEPTEGAEHSPIATQRTHRTGRPPLTSELTETTTKTTSGYTGAGCSAIDPTMHKLTIRPGNPWGVCWYIIDENNALLLELDLDCGSAEQLHWFCSRCIPHCHTCPLWRRLHPLCTASPPRETQSNDLTLHTLRTLIAQNVWAHDAGDSPDVELLDVLNDDDLAAPPPRPPLARTNVGAAR